MKNFFASMVLSAAAGLTSIGTAAETNLQNDDGITASTVDKIVNVLNNDWCYPFKNSKEGDDKISIMHSCEKTSDYKLLIFNKYTGSEDVEVEDVEGEDIDADGTEVKVAKNKFCLDILIILVELYPKEWKLVNRNETLLAEVSMNPILKFALFEGKPLQQIYNIPEEKIEKVISTKSCKDLKPWHYKPEDINLSFKVPV